MTAFSSAMQSLATNLITQFGQSVTFTREAYGSYNIEEGQVESSSTTTFTGVAVPVDYAANEIDGTVIQSGDIKATVALTTSPPQPGDQVALGGTNYRVMNVMTTKVSGDDIIYDIQLRI